MNSSSPAFGISRGRGKTKIQPQNYSSSVPQSQSQSPKTIQNINPTVLKAPIGDLHSSLYSRGQIGDIVFNSINRTMYYNNGSEWIPMSGSDSDRSSVTSDIPKDNPNGPGEDLIVSSGCGSIRDGRLYLQTGGEDKVTIGDLVTILSDLSVEGAIKRKIDTCLVTQMGKFKDKDKTSQLIGFDESESELDLDNDSDTTDDTHEPYLSEISFDNTACRVSATVVLRTGETISGDVINPLINEDSIISASVSTDSGVPMVWFGKSGNGTVKIHLKCLEGELSDLQVFVSIEN